MRPLREQQVEVQTSVDSVPAACLGNVAMGGTAPGRHPVTSATSWLQSKLLLASRLCFGCLAWLLVVLAFMCFVG